MISETPLGTNIIVKAIHPHWCGLLNLCYSDNTVLHLGIGSKGIFELSNRTLIVHWDKYDPEVFTQVSDLFVHNTLMENIPKIHELFAVSIANTYVLAKKISIEIPNQNYEIRLRLQTTDVMTFQQVFLRHEYETLNLPDSANVIVDLGANIGLATVFFGLKYPNAKMLSVEPEKSNYFSMMDNTAALGDRVQKEYAAVWVRDGLINLHTENEHGFPLGEWGVQISETFTASQCLTRCFKMSTLLDKAGFDDVDILKIDIEGAELEVFSNESQEWLSRIKLIVIETHDRFRPGSEAAVRKAVHPIFEELPHPGESLFFRRKAL